jgi:hypothetical protein
MVGPTEREVHVTASAEFKALDGSLAGSERLLHSICQAIESFKSHGEKEIVSVVEVTVGGVVGDAGAARDLAEGESAGTNLANEGNGGLNQRVAQIGMVVGFCGHRLFLSEDVDKSNIQS